MGRVAVSDIGAGEATMRQRRRHEPSGGGGGDAAGPDAAAGAQPAWEGAPASKKRKKDVRWQEPKYLGAALLGAGMAGVVGVAMLWAECVTMLGLLLW